MKIALITGGQPRFTECFIRLMDQLEGFSQADLFLALWNSDWASTEADAENKISKILKSKYSLAKVKLFDQPKPDLPSTKLNHPPAEPENIRWWYYRRHNMWTGLKLAFDLIDGNYDVVVRFRLDGMLDKNVNLNNLNIQQNNLILPNWPRNGFQDRPINDQFAIGSQELIGKYTDLAKEYSKYVIMSDPNWETNGHGTWAGEHVLQTYLENNKIQYTLGDFKSLLAGAAGTPVVGRSKYTDRHYHHSILPDPTK